MTQKQLVLTYIREFGSIIPAKIYGEVYLGVMFGSETSKRCRELRADGILQSEPSGKFERFYLSEIVRKDTMSYDPSTNGKWREIGKKIGSKKYTELIEEELLKKRAVAKKWLAENPNHLKYAEGLSRYEKIEDELSLLSGTGII